MNEVDVARSWSALSELDASAREREMVSRCREAAALPDEERVARLQAMVHAEYALGEEQLHAFTLSRLRAWLTINKDDPGAAERLARGYDAVFDRAPATMAMRRAAMVQTVARQELSLEEVDELFSLVPSLVRSVPRASTQTMAAAKGISTSPSAPMSSAAVGDGGVATLARPWWKFWGR